MTAGSGILALRAVALRAVALRAVALRVLALRAQALRAAALGASALLFALFAAPARAEDYPSRPVMIVVPLAPGGGTDFLARLLARHLEQRLGKPFLIENKPGAANVIAATAVAKAEPDGHTLMMGTTTGMAINVSLRKSLPYNPA